MDTRLLCSVDGFKMGRLAAYEVAARIEKRPQRHPLMPVGDGSSCLDPKGPPVEAWLEAGVCNGNNCHSGSGCPNRVLLINQQRVKEVIHTRRYYDTNWQRLYANNPEAFAAIHMPRMEFTMYLYEYLKRGPYRHLLNG